MMARMDIRSSGLLAMVEQLSAQGQYATALAAADIFLPETPEDIELLNLIGSLSYQAKHFERALIIIEKLESLGAADAVIRSHKARCLHYLRRAPEAVAVMRSIVAEHPQDLDYRILLSQFLQAAGYFDESFELLKTIPDTMSGYHLLMGWHKVRLGDFLGGFRLFQHEPGIIQLARRLNMTQEKQLQKNTDIAGKTILFMLEGGFGDEIFFMRFISQLEARGAHVIVGASRRIIELISGNSNVRDVTTITPSEYDYYLPALYCIDFLAVADPMQHCEFPYLFADTTQAAQWEPIIKDKAAGLKKIGIHWQGNWGFDYLEQKSPPASLMLRFAALGALFNLQRDAGENTLPANSPVFDTETGEPTWARTAAVISQMDYIVTNDTSTAHLAGALGKKTLVLLPHAPHIYWIADKEKSILYPTVLTFRQPTYGDWAGAVDAAYAYIQKDII